MTGRSSLNQATQTARDFSHSPLRVGLLLLTVAGVKAANLLALIAALWAFDGDVATWHVIVVYLVGATAAEAVPAPGGLGTVDAVLLGGLVGTGVSAAAPVAAVAVYRLLSFWAPIVPGLIASGVLHRRMAI